MLDLNFILLFIALASSVILIWRLARLRRDRPAGWMPAAVIVLLISGLSYLFAPSIAGYLGGFLWALLLLAPSLAERKIADLLVEKRYRTARQLALVRHALHPWLRADTLLQLLRALEMASAGDFSSALRLLSDARADSTPAGRTAAALSYALREDWRELTAW